MVPLSIFLEPLILLMTIFIISPLILPHVSNSLSMHSYSQHSIQLILFTDISYILTLFFNNIQQHSTARNLRGSDIFHFSTSTLRLEFHQSTNHLTHRNTSKKIIQLIQSNHLLLHNFVLFNFHPFVPRSVPPFNYNNSNIKNLSSFLTSKISSDFNTDSFSYIVSSPTTAGFRPLTFIKTNSPPSFILLSSK